MIQSFDQVTSYSYRLQTKNRKSKKLNYNYFAKATNLVKNINNENNTIFFIDLLKPLTIKRVSGTKGNENVRKVH